MPGTDWWLQSGTTSTAEGPAMQGQSGQIRAGEISASAITTAKIADDAVTTAKIADSNVTTAKIAASNVTTAKIAASNVTAAKLSTNAGVRLVTLPIVSMRTVSSCGGRDSGNVILYAPHALTVQSVALITASDWVNTTCEVAATLFRNSSSSVADLTLTSTAIVAGARTAFGLTANTAIATDTTLSLKWSYSTCSEPGQASVHVTYLPTS